MRRFLTLITLVLTVVAFLSASTASLAQDATPETGSVPEFPLVPDPALCTVEARTTEEIIALWFPADGTPAADGAEQAATHGEVTIPVGGAADDETTVEIITTMHDYISCAEAGGIKQAFAFHTDDSLANLGFNFVGSGMTRDEAVARLDATPEPAPESGESGESVILAVTDIMQLEDGRVGAFVVSQTTISTWTNYVIVEQVDGRWLIDEAMAFTVFG